MELSVWERKFAVEGEGNVKGGRRKVEGGERVRKKFIRGLES